MQKKRIHTKKILIINIVLGYLTFFLNISCAFGDPFKGRIETQEKIEKEQSEKEKSEIFTGTTDTLNRNDVLKMTVSKVLDASLVKENEEFFAEVTEDVEAKDGIIIPKGTVAHGCIKKAEKAKNFSRNGVLELNFDYVITPDGKEIPIKGKMSTKLHPIASASDTIANNIVYTTAGGVAGGLLALSMFGVGGAISSQGTTIAGGAALGSSVGLAISLYHKGKDVLISPGDEIQVKLSSSAKLPVYKKTAFLNPEQNLNGLDVKISDINYKKDLYGEVDKVVLSLSILNMSDEIFSPFDVALVNDAGTAYYPDIFDGAQLFGRLKQGDKFEGKIPFSVDDLKNNFWLTFYDNNTKEVVAKISLDNAYKEISNKSKKQNKKMLKKKDSFYKDYNPFDYN